MNKRSLSLMIALAIGSAGTAVSAQSDTTDRATSNPPPSAAQSMRGQTYVPDTLARGVEQPKKEVDADLGEAYEDEFAYEDEAEVDVDVDTDLDLAHEERPLPPQVQTQSPPNDPTWAARIESMDDDGRIIDDQVVDQRTIFESDMSGARAVAGPRQDADDFAEQPLRADAIDQTRAETEVEIAAEQPTELRVHPTGTPFAAEAGSQGFADASESTKQTFQQLDEDNDGQLSQNEVPQSMTLGQRFGDYDINGDGMIAKNEFQSYFAAQSWLEGDEQLPREQVAKSESDELESDQVAGTDADELDSELDADVDADLDSDLDTDVDADVDADLDVDTDLEGSGDID